MSSSYLNSTKNLVHPDWEVVDPTPNIHTLFPIFDQKFFQSKLVCVQLEWSKKMYSCAGICYQRTNRLGKSCTIRLSEPLLKLRSRKDLIETLLHEMIHAYCFVMGIREGNGGHGPLFKKMMTGINRIAGTNITVYHTFHDEVNLYKTHWWKCNGVCQSRGPFYGTVKRSSNRKPGPSDFWWAEHQRSCGGEFLKIKEPEPKRKKASANKENELKGKSTSNKKVTKSPVKTPNNNRIPNYFNSTPNTGGKQNPSGFKKPYTGTVANSGGRTVVVRKPPSAKTNTPQPTPNNRPVVKTPKPVVPPGGNLKNVKQFKDLSDSDTDATPKDRSPVALFTGSGNVLGGSSRPGSTRNSRLLDQFSPQEKKPRQEKTKPQPETIDLVADDDEEDYIFEQIDLDQIKQNRRDSIKKEIMNSFADDEMDEIVLIDDEYDDGDDAAASELVNLDGSLTDTSVIDELFGEHDALIDEFNRTNGENRTDRKENEFVACPMCSAKIKRSQLAPHLEFCYGVLSADDDVPFDPNKPSTSKSKSSKSETKSKSSQDREEQQKILQQCGYSESEIAKALATMEEEENRQRVVEDNSIEMQLLHDGNEIDLTSVGEQCECPICRRKVAFEMINQHLDQCLGT
ncbi:DNA-dependent metalloprotease SPRTN [Malaya genurostris]|uniref:DNA-dependent metalloprotease SPRTN n=1 Tax=Malaya genurostris TaxID=325434 RepID=UPI0026F3D100|nr:DNA-dependent metalloprotease SPRTN [Malaya genurostris]